MTESKKITSLLPRRTCVWIDDDTVDECYKCHIAFNWRTRRHHCRGCGRIFCYNCSQSTINTNQSSLNSSGIIDPDKYLRNHLHHNTTQIYRSCHDCSAIFQNINNRATLIFILEWLPLELSDYYVLRQLNRAWYEACNIVLSKFREIQYNLPNHVATRFEHHVLKTNFHLILGHNRLLCQFVKLYDWEKSPPAQSNYYLGLIATTEQTCTCQTLMCSRECQQILTDSEVIDILLHVKYEPVRQIVIKYLTLNEQILEWYVPTLTYAIRFNSYALRTHLINLSIRSKSVRYKFFWELIVQLEEPYYNIIYQETFNQLVAHLSSEQVAELTNGMKLIKHIADFKDNKIATTSAIFPVSIPVNPTISAIEIDHKNTRVMNSATKPLLITFLTALTTNYSVICKSEDIRKDHIIACVIHMMDHILRTAGLDMNIVTYNVLPTTMTTGLIEIVPNSETLYNIKEKSQYSIQNYILENNGKESIDTIRLRFVRSTAAYCVITYLLGIGDRHLDNIMVTKDGRLFHIDYSFVLGLDPKPLAPKLRITQEMIDAIGGQNSKYYQHFEECCDKVYNVLRCHSNLFTNMLYLLTRIDTTKFTTQQLETEINKRFLPGEYCSQAKVHLINAINTSQGSSLTDLWHYHYKETLSQVVPTTTANVTNLLSKLWGKK